MICSLLLSQAKVLLWGSSVLFGPSMFIYNWSNLSDLGALWPGMKPESGLIQTPSTSQHSVLTCTTGLTTSQPSPAHYSYSVEGNLAWFLSASLSTWLSTTNREACTFVLGLCMLLYALSLFYLCVLVWFCICCVPLYAPGWLVGAMLMDFTGWRANGMGKGV